MKIVIIRDGKKIKSFHEPKEIIYNYKTKIVTILEVQCSSCLAEYIVKSEKLYWLQNELTGLSEIMVEFIVHDMYDKTDDGPIV